MATSFPGGLDSLTNPTSSDFVSVVDHAAQHANANDAIEALEAKVGVNSSAVTTSHDYKLSGVTGTDKAVSKTGTETLTNKTLTSPVINSPTGLAKGDVGLGNVDNTSDATKNAASVTLTNKTLTSPVINSPTGIVKGDVGLGNVDNTSDANKPVSTATQTALDLKLDTALIKRVYKSADETVNNSDVLQNDDALLFAVTANQVWSFRIHLIFQSGTTPDIKFGWTVPAATTMIWDHETGYDGGPFTESSSQMEPGFGAGITITVSFWGTVFVGANAGNVQFQWAQNTANASDTKVLKGSHIIATRLA